MKAGKYIASLFSAFNIITNILFPSNEALVATKYNCSLTVFLIFIL